MEAVRQQITKAAGYLARETYDDFLDATLSSVDLGFFRLESPLEAIFFAWWQALTWNAQDYSTLSEFRLQPQRDVVCCGNTYRLDFVIRVADQKRERAFVDTGRSFPNIAIEVDGHAFHEKTFEQVAYRNQRDRELQQEGWIVFHFSWSELVQDGAARVGDVLAYAVQKFRECEEARANKWEADHPENGEKIRRLLEEHARETAEAAAGNKADGTERGTT